MATHDWTEATQQRPMVDSSTVEVSCFMAVITRTHICVCESISQLPSRSIKLDVSTYVNLTLYPTFLCWWVRCVGADSSRLPVQAKWDPQDPTLCIFIIIITIMSASVQTKRPRIHHLPRTFFSFSNYRHEHKLNCLKHFNTMMQQLFLLDKL